MSFCALSGVRGSGVRSCVFPSTFIRGGAQAAMKISEPPARAIFCSKSVISNSSMVCSFLGSHALSL